MTTALRLVTPPAIPPVSVEEVKAQARIDFDDDDDLIERLIKAAVSHVDAEGDLGRAMITQTWAQFENQSPGWVRLRMGPFQALQSVQYWDKDSTLQTADLADFETRLHGDFVICKPKENREWPTADTRGDAIKITYTAGYGDAADDVPQGVRHAILMIATHWYENRSASVDGKLASVPIGAAALIANERVGWYG